MSRARTDTAIVVGSGPNGLAAAVRLARSGLDDTVLEAAVWPSLAATASRLMPQLMELFRISNQRNHLRTDHFDGTHAASNCSRPRWSGGDSASTCIGARGFSDTSVTAST